MIFFNLLGVNRGEENTLSNFLMSLMSEENKESSMALEYFHVDFHALTKETDFSNIDQHIYSLTKNLDFNQFAIENDELKPISVQKKMVRTNCMDCLDRTNAVQTKIAFDILY